MAFVHRVLRALGRVPHTHTHTLTQTIAWFDAFAANAAARNAAARAAAPALGKVDGGATPRSGSGNDRESALLVEALETPVATLKTTHTAAHMHTLARTAHSHGAHERASQLYILSAAKGHIGSLLTVGLAHIRGYGRIPPDPREASRLLAAIYEKTKHPWAAYGLGVAGLQVAVAGSVAPATATPAEARPSAVVPAARAIELLQEASASDTVPPAPLRLAHALMHGEGVAVDLREGLRWMATAAARGDPQAAAELAALYSRGVQDLKGERVLPKNADAAASLWQIAADGGHAIAMHNVGIACLIQEDAPRALHWFSRAADRGYIPSMLNAGELLITGHAASGVAADVSAARGYFQRAADEATRQLTSVASAVESRLHKSLAYLRDTARARLESASADLRVEFARPDDTAAALREIEDKWGSSSGMAADDIITLVSRHGGVVKKS